MLTRAKVEDNQLCADQLEPKTRGGVAQIVSVKGAQKGSIEKKTTNAFSQRNPFFFKKISKETLKEEFKLVISESFQFENRQNNHFLWVS